MNATSLGRRGFIFEKATRRGHNTLGQNRSQLRSNPVCGCERCVGFKPKRYR